MFAWLGALSAAIGWILYATKAGPALPWTPTGFTILAILCIALHLAWAWYPWRHP